MQRRTLFAIFAAGLIAMAGPALADLAASKALVDAGKAQGTVGEQADGFLGIVKGSDPALKAAVDEINSGRRKVYEEASKKSGASIEAAAQSAGKTLIEKLPKGQQYRPLGGPWTTK